MTEREDEPADARRGLFDLIGGLPDLVTRLVRDEIGAAKQEIGRKGKAAGIGLGILAAAAVLAVFALGVLLTAAVAGLAQALPGWLAALLVAAALLVLIAIVAAVGLRSLKRGLPPVPSDTIESVRTDVRTITGRDA